MNTYTIEGLIKEIEENREELNKYNKEIERHNQIIDNNNKILTEYMKQNNYNNSTIGKYISINNLLELTFIQKDIKDINILRHIIEKLSITESLKSYIELKRIAQNHINKKSDQLSELVKYKRVFTS